MSLPELYEQALAEWSDMRGHLPTLAECVVKTRARVVVELGVRTGISTVAFLSALEQTEGRLWSCDIRPPDVPSEVSRAPHWTFCLGDDVDMAGAAPRPVDILFIDTSHTYEHTLAELRAYVPLVRPGGLVLAHDTGSYPDVARALDEYFGPDGWTNREGSFGLGVAEVSRVPQRRQTLVSCLFDLPRRDGKGRPIGFYSEHGAYLLGLDQPLVVYTDPELAGWIVSARTRAGHGEITEVISRPLENLELAAVLPLVSEFPTFSNNDPERGTPSARLLQWSKFDLLDETMAADPFGTDHFAWIDFGIGHVARPPEIFPAPTERISILQMVAVAPTEIEEKLGFLSSERGRIAGGFFRGDRDHLRELIRAFRGELASVLACRFSPHEQGLLSYLSATRPELFDFYFGDYGSILTNWDLVRHDLQTVFLNIAHCREHRLWDTALDACERVSASAAAGVLTMNEEDWARLLDEQYIAAWHAGEPRLAARARDELLASYGASDYFERHRSRIETNLALLEPIPPSTRGTVSVIVPVHNGEATLERAVQSVLNQTVPDVEVVIVDDASTDGSRQLAQRLSAQDQRITIVERDVAAGSPATPRDDGISVATGRYIALLDQDDYWLPDKLARQIPLFADDDVAVVYSDAYHENSAGDFSTMSRSALRLPDGDILSELVIHDVVAAPTAVIRRDWVERIGRFDRNRLVGADDYYYWLRISLKGGRFAAVNAPTAAHTWRPDSLGNTAAPEVFASWHRLFAALAEEFPDRLEAFPMRYHLPCIPDGPGLRQASVALCMIVRDESAVIERCIASVRHLISHWVICDTGSSDDTPERIRRALSDLPGELHHRPWRDFGTNRTELLELAKGAADYLLLIDADMTIGPTRPIPPLRADAYQVRCAGPLDYAVPRLVRGDRSWRYIGTTHEYLTADEPFNTAEIPGVVVTHHADGGSRGDKLQRDLRLLEHQLAACPNDDRATFYLAQTHRDLGHDTQAIELYERRAGMGGFEEEAFYAGYQAAALIARHDPAAGFAALLQAWQRRPTRAEPLYDAACVARQQAWWELARLVAERGSLIPQPDDMLFVHRWAYEWGLLMERSIAAWWTGRTDECLELSDRLLQDPALPPEVQSAAEANRALCLPEQQPSRGPRVASLEQLVPATRWARITLDVDPPWPSFNPTIAPDGDGFRAIVRTANYRIVDGRYQFLDGAEVVRTINYMVWLDRDLCVVDVRPLVDRSGRPRYPTEVQGYEDLRLLRWRDSWFATATVRDSNPELWCEIALLTIEGDAVVESRILPRPRPNRHEKNWMPYVAGDELRLVYTCEPLRLYRWDTNGLEPVTEPPTGNEPVSWRGGSAGVPIEGGTLFLVHEVVGAERQYVHRFVLLTDRGVEAASRAFTFTGQLTEYAAGMARRDGELIVSFGLEDAVAALAVVPLQGALGLLEPREATNND